MNVHATPASDPGSPSGLSAHTSIEGGELDGKVVLVTGGGGDVGMAVASHVVRAGGLPVLADVDGERATGAAQTVGGRAIRLDVSDEVSLRAATDELTGLRDGCYGVVHCAGIAQITPFLEHDPATWDRLYRVNQWGPARLTQLLLPAMTAAGGGRVVFISSDSARAGAAGEAVYAATKAALLGLAKSLAREHARNGITVNLVCPGPIEGHMAARHAQDNSEHLARLTRAIPLRRLATPDDVAAAIGWLIGPHGGYVTGQTLSISGGLTMH